MTAAPAAPESRGRTHISTRALTRVVTAVAADALGVRLGQVSVDMADDAGWLDLTVRVPLRAVPLERIVAVSDAGDSAVADAEQVQDDIRVAVSTLTGTQIAGVTVSVTSSLLHRSPKPPPEKERTL